MPPPRWCPPSLISLRYCMVDGGSEVPWLLGPKLLLEFYIFELLQNQRIGFDDACYRCWQQWARRNFSQFLHSMPSQHPHTHTHTHTHIVSIAGMLNWNWTFFSFSLKHKVFCCCSVWDSAPVLKQKVSNLLNLWWVKPQFWAERFKMTEF